MSLNVDLLLRETTTDLVANVYRTQARLNDSYSHDYHVAYAYGNDKAPQDVHKRVAVLGAQELGLSTERYLELWDVAVQTLIHYNDLPEQFKDPRYDEQA